MIFEYCKVKLVDRKNNWDGYLVVPDKEYEKWSDCGEYHIPTNLLDPTIILIIYI